MAYKNNKVERALLTTKELEMIYKVGQEYGSRSNRVALVNDVTKLLYDSKKNWMSKMKQKTNQLFKKAS